MLKKPHKFRVLLVGGMFCVLSGLVGARLADLQLLRYDDYTGKAEARQTKRYIVHPERGDVLDHKGRLLATSTGTLSVYIWPKFFQSPNAEVDLNTLAAQVEHFTGVSRSSLLSRFQGDAITSVGRKLDPEVAQKVYDLFDQHEISRSGFWFERESKRRYPRRLASHIIGFTSTDSSGDNLGSAGLELSYNDELNGQRIEGRSSRTGIRQAMEPIPPSDLLDARGHTLVLTIDAALQEAAEAAVERAAMQFEADACGAVVQDVETGAILAMASWPNYDNSRYGEFPAEYRRNRILTDPLETGSVAKLFTAAILLDAGKVRLDTMVDCEGGRARIGPRIIRDSPGHYLNTVPFYEVIRHSSNVGTIKAAQLLENEEWYAYLRAFGLGGQTGLDLPGEGSGILRPPNKWDDYSRTSLPMGYEMALTPIQIVNGVTGLVNGGELLEPYIVAEMRDARGNTVWKRSRTVRHRMIRPATSYQMRQVMEDVVVNGTGKKAQMEGFRVGGKTGTTVKSHIHTHKEYIASFAGALPIDQPKVSIYTFVDNPQGAHYASVVAAPVFHEIAKEAVLQLGILPTGLEKEEVVVENQPTESNPLLPLNEETRAALREGMMPDLRGLSMAEARSELPRTVNNVRFLGSGRLIDQSPVAGEPLNSSPEVVLVFSPHANSQLTVGDELTAVQRSQE